ncbi:hypothetical protein [Rhizobium sp. G21]|uniref:hypothetical protein n=1 Tax=Rhizobium sp. G21 TaxID=2758439 RepID=UPI0016001B40|nr:hypothetical protein [Rhizobium sp. G21]MBB1247578.1 hypothetical protein [Rhizobium sp. G21]
MPETLIIDRKHQIRPSLLASNGFHNMTMNVSPTSFSRAAKAEMTDIEGKKVLIYGMNFSPRSRASANTPAKSRNI